MSDSKKTVTANTAENGMPKYVTGRDLSKESLLSLPRMNVIISRRKSSKGFVTYSMDFTVKDPQLKPHIQLSESQFYTFLESRNVDFDLPKNQKKEAFELPCAYRFVTGPAGDKDYKSIEIFITDQFHPRYFFEDKANKTERSSIDLLEKKGKITPNWFYQEKLPADVLSFESGLSSDVGRDE